MTENFTTSRQQLRDFKPEPVLDPKQENLPLVVRKPGREELDPKAYRTRRRWLETSLAIAIPILLLALWELAARLEWIDPRFFPAPSSIWSSAVTLIQNGDLWEDMLVSYRRVAIGFFLGCATGIIGGILLGMSRLVRAALEPLVYALWTVPKLALLPLLLLIFGIGEMPIIVLIAINCFFLVLIPTLAAIVGVDFPYREAASSFEATRLEMLRHVLLPAAIPQIFVSLRLAAGASILVLVAAEFVQGNTGLGHLIWNSWSLFLADRMYVGIVVVAVSGALFTMLIAAIGRRIAPWAEQA
jgi:sulfonate transport system permease protein